ncbi:MAG: GIY-YIG nuclease family protein [Saprospiraceae bacterium]|nr:GIY-YIG nuclease family protein [Saprospiraceae bacterium]
MKNHNYYTYILTNENRTVLYTGVTNDLEKRLIEHQQDSNGAKKTFAGRYNCTNLVYYEYYQYVQHAIAREKQIKGWKRSKKVALIEHFNPQWRFLNDPIEIEKGDLPVWYVGDEPPLIKDLMKNVGKIDPDL